MHDTMEDPQKAVELEKNRADGLLTACNLGLKDDVARLIAEGATFDCTVRACGRTSITVRIFFVLFFYLTKQRHPRAPSPSPSS